MGRSLTVQQTVASNNLISGTFGKGLVKSFTTSGTFTVPDGVTSVRVRVWSGGGSGALYTTGYAGGTSSFGSYVSVTGGAAGRNATAFGGVSTGGDINHTGGSSLGSGTTTYGSGGGGAANVFGPGGAANSGGTSGGGGSPNNIPGGSGFATSVNALDFIGAGSGGTGGTTTGGTAGFNGGGGGGGSGAPGWPGGGSGGYYYSGGGGGGFGMKTITGLTAGTNISVTVGYGGSTPGNPVKSGANGWVLVEY